VFPRKPTRLTNFDYLGPWRYSLTFCAAHKREAFTNPTIVTELVQHLMRTCDEQWFELIAYCFMPDHLHLLVQGAHQDSHLPTFCRLVRQRMAHAYAGQAGARLWQPGYFERVLREEEQTDQCANYILSNPIRAGLALSIEYPFSGGTWYRQITGPS
jgi:putative transposase